MEPHEINHIQTNLPELISKTLCTIPLITRLQKLGVLSAGDVEEIEYKAQTPQEKSKKLYDILQTRTNGYQTLITAFRAERQTGAVRILEAVTSTESLSTKVKQDDDLKRKLETLKLPDNYLELTLSYLTGGSHDVDMELEPPILHKLVLHGADKQTLQNCIFRGCDPYCLDSCGRTLFHYAAKGGNYEIIPYLLSLRFNINQKDAKGKTPLLASVSANNNILCTVETLLENGADIDAMDNDENDLFLLACQEGWTCAHLTEIIEKIHCPQMKNKSGQSALHMAAKGGNHLVIGYLLNIGVELEDRDKNGKTPLLMTAEMEQNFLLTFRGFLKYGAKINSVDNDGNNLFILAALNNKSVTELSEIAKAGVSTKLKNNRSQTALHLAAKGGNYKVLSYLMSIEPDIHERDKSGCTPLLCSVSAKDNFLETLRWLIKEGADGNTVDKEGDNLFSFAALNKKSVSELSEIAALGVNTKATNIHGLTALHMAANGGNFSVVGYLKSIGLNINHPDNNGCTPIRACVFAESNFLETVQTFLDNGADINAVDNDGDNFVLEAVSEKRSTEEIDMLVENGANWKIQNKRGQSVLHIAAENKAFELFEYFMLKGADMYLLGESGDTFILSSDDSRTRARLLNCVARHDIKIKLSSVLADQMKDNLYGIDIGLRFVKD